MQQVTTLPNFSTWEEYKQKTKYFDAELPNFRSVFYRTGEGDETLSAGMFYMHNTLTHIAWGVMNEEHCGFHAVTLDSGNLSEPILGCPDVKILFENEKAVGYELKELGRTFVWK